MNFNSKKELPLIIISILPASFLAYLWNTLPDKVPLHWNINGEIDRYRNKTELLLIGLIPIFLYALLLFIPLIDPKKRLTAMGNKYYTIRLITTLFISILFTYIIFSVKEQSLGNPNFIFMVIGMFFMLLGNYFKTIKPNYFVGIRTPWTLENEDIWKSTHKMGGKLWVVGGFLIIVCCFIFNKTIMNIIFLSITAVIVLVPIVYSYLKYKGNPERI